MSFPLKELCSSFHPLDNIRFSININPNTTFRVARMDTKSLTIGLCLIFIQCSFNQAVSVREFYPFSRFTDSRLPANDDGSSGELTLSVPFPFFKSKYQHLYVSRCNTFILYPKSLGRLGNIVAETSCFLSMFLCSCISLGEHCCGNKDACFKRKQYFKIRVHSLLTLRNMAKH